MKYLTIIFSLFAFILITQNADAQKMSAVILLRKRWMQANLAVLRQLLL